jgi:hypothetical protein
MKTPTLVILLSIAWVAASAQVKRDPPGGLGTGYSSATLGFRYTPPSEMLNKTELLRNEIQLKAEASNAKNKLDALLAMSSGLNDAAPDWHSLTIETYPRDSVADPDDTSAEAKMSTWVAGISGSPGKPRTIVLSGQSFLVYVIGEQEGTLKKGAVIWTTIRKGKLLSFAFVANSPEQLKALAETMKTVQFF